MSTTTRHERPQPTRREEVYDILDAHEASGGGERCIHVHYEVSYTDFDLDDPRLPADLLTNWADYQFIKVYRGDRYVHCTIRRRDPAATSALMLCEVRYARQVGMTQHSVTGCRDEEQAEFFKDEALRTARRAAVAVSIWLVRGTYRERGGQVITHISYTPRRGRRASKIRKKLWDAC